MEDAQVVKKDEQQVIAEVQHRLMDRFAELPADRVTATVTAAHQHFIASTVRDYIGLLVERRASVQLQAGLNCG